MVRSRLPSVSLLTTAGGLLAIAAMPGHARAETAPLQALIGDPGDFRLAGSVRVRYETLSGQPRTGLNATDEQLAIRSTLLAEYHAANVRIGAEMYDSRAYLTKPGGAITANEVNTFEFVQAYVAVDLRQPFGAGSKATVEVGRMMLNLGSRRLVAADDYRNTTNSYTGVRADVALRGGVTGTFIYTLPQIRLPDDLPSVRDNKPAFDRESFDLRLWGGLIARPRTIAGATAELGYFRLQERDGPARPTRNRNLHSVSARLIRDPATGRFDGEVEGIYQFGSVRGSLAANAPLLDVSAGFVHADVGYTFAGPAKLRLSAEYDLASGDGRGRRFTRFDTLFGMRRADLSPAGILAAIGRTNISTPGLRAEIAPSKRLDAFASWHAMWLAGRSDAFSTTGVRDAAGKSGRFAGHHIDARVRYWLLPGILRGEINAVYLAKGRFLKDAPNAPDTGNTRYLSAALTATF